MVCHPVGFVQPHSVAASAHGMAGPEPAVERRDTWERLADAEQEPAAVRLD